MKNLPLVLLFVALNVRAQKFALEGIVKNTDSIALDGATVYLQSLKDSLPIAYGITNKSGKFALEVNTDDDKQVIFNIVYLGYKSYKKVLYVPNQKILNIGMITLNAQVEELNVVSISAKSPPVVIKKDTIEYNASSFKTMVNDKVEDLLKKLPGLEIDLDGIITINGIQVEAINIDGASFFGEKNGAIALKNIPSHVISKIQITDYKTNLQKFTGEASDSDTKEINLKIKKGKNKASFGAVNLGYGTDQKYQANANLFQLIEGKQLGIITGTNNINMNRGFNALPDANSSNGYIESDFIGANFSKGKWNETRMNGNYTYSTQNSDNAQKSYAENFLPNLNYNTNSESNGFNDADTHQVSTDFNFIVKSKSKKSTNRVQISNETNYNASQNVQYAAVNRTSEYTNGDLVSSYISKNQTYSQNYSFSNNFSVISKYGTKRDFFNLGFSTDFNKQDDDGINYSKNDLVTKGTSIVQDQISNTNNSDSRVNVYGRWHKEVFTNFKIISGYNAIITTENGQKFIFDFDDTALDYTNFNTQISMDSKYVTTTIKPSLRLRYNYEAYRFEIETAYTNTFRAYEDLIIEERNFKNDFKYVNYSGRIRYRDKNGFKNISLDYKQNVRLPSVRQLQPIANVSNITNIVTGNPFLNPAINHDIDFKYQNNLSSNNINISANVHAEFVNGKIINVSITDSDLIKYTTFQNINGDYSLSGNAAITKSYFKKNTNVNINFRINGNYKNILSVQNSNKFVTNTNTIEPAISFGYSFKKKIDISTSYSYALTTTKYHTGLLNDNAFFVQYIRLESSIFFFKNTFLTNKASYRYNSRVGDDFDGAAIFWNAGLGLQFWKDKATLTAVGYDILGKNNGYSRLVSETSIQAIENKILEQYFMLTFIYKFGNFAGQNMNTDKENLKNNPSKFRRRGR